MAKNFDYILLLAKEVPGFKRLSQGRVNDINTKR